MSLKVDSPKCSKQCLPSDSLLRIPLRYNQPTMLRIMWSFDNANNFTSINLSLWARGHSFGSRIFKMVVLSTMVPRPFSYDDLNFLERPYRNTPLPLIEIYSLPQPSRFFSENKTVSIQIKERIPVKNSYKAFKNWHNSYIILGTEKNP